MNTFAMQDCSIRFGNTTIDSRFCTYLRGSERPLHGAAEEHLSPSAGRHAAPHDLQLQLLVGQQQVPAQDRQHALLQTVHGRVHL